MEVDQREERPQIDTELQPPKIRTAGSLRFGDFFNEKKTDNNHFRKTYNNSITSLTVYLAAVELVTLFRK